MFPHFFSSCWPTWGPLASFRSQSSFVRVYACGGSSPKRVKGRGEGIRGGCLTERGDEKHACGWWGRWQKIWAKKNMAQIVWMSRGLLARMFEFYVCDQLSWIIQSGMATVLTCAAPRSVYFIGVRASRWVCSAQEIMITHTHIYFMYSIPCTATEIWKRI